MGGSQLAADIRAVGASLRAIVSGLEPKDVPLPFAPEVLAALVEVQRLAESGRVLMTARAAEAGEWQRQRFASPSDWLAAQQGTTSGRARADLETSERLGSLEDTADAVREGRLSPEQAGAVADGAAANPAAERDLLDQAQRDSLRRTRQEAERRKAEVRSEEEQAERDRKVRKDRSARFWYGNGAGHLELRGPIAEVKDLEQRLARLVDKKFKENRSPERRESRANYAFDSLIELSRGAASSGSSTKAPLTRLTLIRVDLAALRRGSLTEGELCEIGGVPVSVAELRRALGDSVLQLVLTNGEAVVDVVNLNRKPTVAQMVAKLFTDSCCTVQGCDRAVRLEFDHRDDWARVLTTELHNLDLPCDHHHDLKTSEGWKLVAGSGRRPMVPPGHPDHPDTRPDEQPTAARSDPAAAEASATHGAHADVDPGYVMPDDLRARVERIRQKDREHRARRAGQDPLFPLPDTG